ncbi:MAG: tRNA pseudouridine(38-40) synthase TruA [Bdellovibrionales bacterium RBG_16_40_8]|nr:MAG: tRNA pseudouridine(38-40) synthase TruA [Bdellovibrionales bacterium RBG_16_40_8]
MKIKLLISYDGTDYAGWQKQGDRGADLRPTIQSTLECALTKIFGTKIHIQASGRTDAGTHAAGQVAHFKVPEDALGNPIKNPEKMKLVRSLNALTPPSLSIKKAWIAPNHFHALRSAQGKTYRYIIHNSSTPNSLADRYSVWVERPLSVDRLNELSACLIGEHDFKSFQTRGTELKSTIRTITEATWRYIDHETIEFRLTGTGFLKQMVRNIVGTLIYLHQNKLKSEEMTKILKSCDRQAAKWTAEAKGLFLDTVYYPSDLDNECREL